MNPTLIMMAVRAAARLQRAGSEAIGQYARDRTVLLPLVEKISFPQRAKVRGYFEVHPEKITPDLSRYWDSFTGKPGAERLADAFDLLSAEHARQQIIADKNLASRADEFAGYWMVNQWARGEEPLGPFARVVLVIVDVAAEFAATDPKLFGLDGNAESLVKAVASRVADLVPDNADALGPRNLFGERVAAIFLKAGLGALAEHPEAIVEDAHLQKLVTNTLPKIVESLPESLDKQIKWRGVLENVLGPVAGEALRTLAEDPGAFFGAQFGNDDVLGTLTRTYVLKIADLGLTEVVSKAGAVQLFKATAQLAAARPDLFLGKTQDSTDKLIGAVFKDLASVAAGAPAIDRSLVLDLATSVVESFAREGGLLLDPGKPWDNLVAQLLNPVLAPIAQALKQDDSAALRRLGSRANIESILRVVVARVAATPGLMPSTRNAEIDRLISAIVTAMASDEHLLLSQDDWMAILAAAAQEVAANPGRLLGVERNAERGSLLDTLLGDLLSVAVAQWTEAGRAGGAVMFGATLRDAMIAAIRAHASNAAAAALHGKKVGELAAQLGKLVTDNREKMGGSEWLFLYRTMIHQVIESGVVPILDEQTIRVAVGAAGVAK